MLNQKDKKIEKVTEKLLKTKKNMRLEILDEKKKRLDRETE